tara:strand:- start:2889 stop:3206 length:318 start_codon:yes stop_codon:yes gene_type:complete
MNESKIRLLQKQYGFKLYQDLIDSGEAWKIGGEITKDCKNAINSGACFLAYKSYHLNIFNSIPSRYQVKRGSKGSVEASKKYWSDGWNIAKAIGKSVSKTKEQLV